MTMADLRKWVADNSEISDETKIAVNVDGMEGTGKCEFNYYHPSRYHGDFIPYIWIQDAD